MKSPASERLFYLSRLLNRLIFPSLGGIIAFAVIIPNTTTYFALRSLIPPDSLPDARHAALFAGYIPSLCIGLAVAACAVVAGIIDWKITRPLVRLVRWAEERQRKGEGPGIRLRTPVIEIINLARVFIALFGEQICRVKELRTLIGSTRHDIRNHLTAINSAAQYLRSDANYDRLIAVSKTQTAVDTITHILDINAEITQNYCNIRGPAAHDLRISDIVHDCLDKLELDAAQAGVTLTSEIPPRSLMVVAHRALLESVIRNLVGNAIKYTPQGGEINLSVQECPAAPSRPDAKASAPSQIEIRVADTGMGIPDEDKPHVFEREYRARATRGIPGTGYGLAAVDSVVTFYHGTARIDDNRPRGTIFTIRLPLPHPSSTNPQPQTSIKS